MFDEIELFLRYGPEPIAAVPQRLATLGDDDDVRLYDDPRFPPAQS